MADKYSYLVEFERKDGKPNDEYYFESEDEAREYISNFDNPKDEEIRGKYYCISLVKVDWLNHANSNLDGIVFDDE